MDSRFLGFSIEYESEKLSFEQFMQDMADEFNHKFSSNASTGNDRILYINSNHDKSFYIGMVVTIRDQKKFCRGKISNDDWTFDVVNLKQDDKMLEFNYFIINKKTKLGLYQYYHQSCAPRILGKMLKELLHSYSVSHADASVASETAKCSKPLSLYKTQKIRRQFKSTLNFSILVRKEELKSLLEQYKKIKSFEFEYTTLTPEIQKATPLANHVCKKKEYLRFHTPTDIFGLASSIANFTKTSNLKSGRVKVEDEYGEEFPLRIFNMPDYFAVHDFDELADKLANIKASEFYESKIVDLLVECHNDEQYDHIFQMKVLDEA